MANKPKFLKNLLMTTSALSVLAAGAGEALGAASGVSRNNPAALSNAGQWNSNGGGGALPAAGANTVLFIGGAHNLSFDAVYANLGTLNAYGNGGQLVTTTVGGYQITNVINDVTAVAAAQVANNGGALAAGANAGATNFNINSAHTVEFGLAGAGDLSGLGTIALSNAGAIAKFSANNAQIKDINANGGAGRGTVEANATGLQFANIGNTTAVRNFTVLAGNSATIEGNATAANAGKLNINGTAGNAAITIGAGSTLSIGNNATISGVKGGNNVTIDGNGGAGNGTLVFEGNSTVIMPEGIGAAVALLSFNVGGAPIGSPGGTPLTAGTVVLDNVAVLNSNTIQFGGDQARLKLGTNFATVVTTGDIKSVDGKGTIEVDGNNMIVATKSIGTLGGNTLAAIEFSSNNSLSLFANGAIAAGTANGTIGVAAVKNTSGVNNQGTLVLGLNAAQTIISDIGDNTANGSLLALKIHSNDGNNGALTTVTLSDGKSIYAATVDLDSGNALDNALVLGANTKINGAVDTTQVARGIISVNGASHITGKIGNTNAIAGINFKGAHTLTIDSTLTKLDGANHTVASGGVVGAGVNFGANDGTLAFTATGATALTVHAVNGANGITMTDGNGTISSAVTANNAFTITSKIGSNAASLKEISVTGGGNLELTGGDVYVKTIDMGNSASTVSLKQNAGSYKIGNLANAANSILNIDAGGNQVTVLAGSGANAATANTLTVSKVNFVAANDKLTLQDGVNVTATNGFTNTADGKGKLELIGSHVITGQVGTSNVIRLGEITITAGAADKVTTFENDVYSNSTITLTDANAAVKFKGNVIATSIDGNGPNNGTVEFINPNGTPVKHTGNIGNANAVKVVKISGGDVEITGTVASNTGFAFEANSTGALTLSRAAADALGANNVKVGADGANEVIVVDDNTITGTIGEAGKFLGAIVLNNADVNGKTITFNSAADVFTGVDFKQDGTHHVVIQAATANSVFKNIGVANAAKDIVVHDGVAATFDGTIVTKKGLKLGHTVGGAGVPNTTANFKDGAVVNTTIDTIAGTAAANLGKVNFAGKVDVLNEIGGTTGMLEVNFNGNAGKAVSLAANIKSTAIKMQKDNFSVDNNVTLDGLVTSTSSTVDLKKNQLTFKGGVVSTAAGDMVLHSSYDGSAAGQIVVSDNNSKLDISGLTSLTVTIDDTEATMPGATARTVSLAVKQNQGQFTTVAGNKITLTNNSRFVKWDYTGTDLTFTETNNSVAALKQIFAGNSNFTNEDADTLGNPNNTGDAAALQQEFRNMDAKGRSDLIIQAVQELKAVEEVTAAASQMTTAMTGAISNRISSVGAPIQFELGQAAGIAAGDEPHASYGIWGAPFYSQGVQKAKNSAPGYKNTASGLTIGFDTMANDTMTVGVAASIAQSNVKFKAPVAGDKTKSNTYMFSVYGVQEITENWFLQAIASFGSSSVKNTAKRTTLTGSETATGKYDSMTYGGEVLGGYNVRVADTAMVTPMFGLKYNRFNDTGYKETGLRARTISKKSVDKIEGVLGARATFATEMSGVTLTPELHGFLNYDFRGKAPNVTARIDGLVADSLNVAKNKPAKAMFNVGLGVYAKSGMMEYGAGYDAYMAKKYLAHQGSLKVRVNF